MPAASTVSFTSRVVRISRRSGWSAIASGNRSRRGRGKYSGSRLENADVSGRSEASTRACRSSFACATRVASSGLVSPCPADSSAANPALSGSTSSCRSMPRRVSRSATNRRCTRTMPGACARPTPSRAFCVRLSASTRSATSSVISTSSALRASRSSRAVRDQPVEQDLDVDLVVAAVDARGVVDRIGVDLPAVAGELDAAPLGQPEVAALADDLDAQLARIGADRVVGLVARRRRGSPRSP